MSFVAESKFGAQCCDRDLVVNGLDEAIIGYDVYLGGGDGRAAVGKLCGACAITETAQLSPVDSFSASFQGRLTV